MKTVWMYIYVFIHIIVYVDIHVFMERELFSHKNVQINDFLVYCSLSCWAHTLPFLSLSLPLRMESGPQLSLWML